MTEKYLNLRQWLPRCSFSLCSGTRCLQSVFFFSGASCGSTETSFQFFMLLKQYVFSILFSLRKQRRAVHAFLYAARVFFPCSWLRVKSSCVISAKSLQSKKPLCWETSTLKSTFLAVVINCNTVEEFEQRCKQYMNIYSTVWVFFHLK